jgi:hypothetical protein
VQQQALRDFARAMAAFLDPANPARRPTWRRAGRDEGFRITGQRGRQWDVRRLSDQEQGRERPHRACGRMQAGHPHRQQGAGVGHDPCAHYSGEPVRAEVP